MSNQFQYSAEDWYSNYFFNKYRWGDDFSGVSESCGEEIEGFYKRNVLG